MRVTVDLVGDREVMRALERLSDEKKRRVKAEVRASGIDVQREAKERLKALRAWDLGNLANSILVDLTADGMTAEIGPEAPYGPHIEFGTKPHFPPLDALEGWAKRHGFDSAWPIAKAISEKGTPAQPFLFPAWLAVKDEFWKRIRRMLER
jgi:hypothetical protein